MAAIQITNDDGFVISKELGEEPPALELLHEVYMMMLHYCYTEEQIESAFKEFTSCLCPKE